MSESKYMFVPNNEIFTNLKDFIVANATLSTPYVNRSRIEKKYPCVIFEEARNERNRKSTTHDNTIRIMNYNINIYSSKLEDNYAVAMELSELVSKVMEEYYNMDGGIIAIMPNFDDPNPSYQINMRYTTRYYINNNKLF